MPTVAEYNRIPYEQFEGIRDRLFLEAKGRQRLITAEYSKIHELGRFVFTNIDDRFALWLRDNSLVPDTVYRLIEFPDSVI